MGKKKMRDRSKHLKIGDTILLYYRTIPKHGVKNSGYVNADLSGSFYPQLLLVKPSGRDTPDLPDIQLGTFQIIATNKYGAQAKKRELTTELRKLEKLSENMEQRYYDDDFDHPTYWKLFFEIDRVEDKLKDCQTFVEAEKVENKAKQEQLKGNSIRYDECVQLRHTLTGKCICVAREISETEDSKLKVYLKRKESLECVFRLHPHVKVEVVGEEINYEDTIKFESLAIQGQFLHCSKKPFTNSTANSECFELNMSAKGSPLKVIPHYKASDESGIKLEKTLRASGVVKFYNHNHQCYIMGEGTFAGKQCEKYPRDKDDVIIKDVHFKRKQIKIGLTTSSSSSPETFWQIEKSNNKISGNPMKWKEECRIKHLPSRRYLAVIEKPDNVYKVTLKMNEESSTQSEVFQLYRALHTQIDTDAGNNINYDAYVRVWHKETKTWLHFDSEISQATSDEDLNDFIPVSASRDISSDDVFSLEKVEQKYVIDFNYIASVTAALAKQVSKCEEINNGSEHAMNKGCNMESTLSTLDHFKDLIIRDEVTSRKFKKKLIRSMHTLNLVIRLMKFHIHEKEMAKLDAKVCTTCLEVLIKFLEGKSGNNRKYMPKNIDLIFDLKVFDTKLTGDISIEEAFIGLVKSNREMLEENDFWINTFLDKLSETRKQGIAKGANSMIHLLNGLSSLCSYDGIPQKKVQCKILEIIVERKDVKESVFCCMIMKAQKVQHNPAQVMIQMEDKVDLVVKKDGIHYQIALAQYDLLTKLCVGNNADAIKCLTETADDVIADQFKLDFIIKAINCSSGLLKARLVELLKVLHVEADKNEPFLERIPLSFKFDDIGKNTEEDKTKPVTGESKFSILSTWIRSELKKDILYANCDEENEVTVKVLQLVSALVKYGYYHRDDDVNTLVTLLLPWLDSSNDQLQNNSTKGDYEETAKQAEGKERKERVDDQDCKDFRLGKRYAFKEEYQNYYAIKHSVMETLHFFFHFQLYKSLHILIHDFRWLKQNSVSTGEQNGICMIMTEQIRRPPKMDDSFLQTSYKEMDKEMDRKDIANAKERLDTIKKSTAIAPLMENLNFKLLVCLLDTAKYDAPDLVQYSLLLLDQYFSTESSLFDKAQQTVLLTNDNSIKLYKYIHENLQKFTAYFQCDDTASQHIQKLTESCWVVEGCEPHRVFQKIIISFGIFSDLLKFVVHHCNSLNSHNVTKINECLQLLHGLACQNPKFQERLFEHIDIFLKACSTNEIGTRICRCMGRLLQSIFNGGPTITLTVKEEHVVIMMNLLFGSMHGCDPAIFMMSALMELINVTKFNLPIKHNQLIVTRNFSSLRDEIIDLHDKDRGARLTLLLTEKKEKRRCNLLMITDLLASCAQGDNEEAQSVCSTVFSREELMSIITHEKISFHCKRPFMKFMMTVYKDYFFELLTTIFKDDLKEMKTKHLELKNHIIQVVKVLFDSCQVIKDARDSVWSSIKKFFFDPTWKYRDHGDYSDHQGDLIDPARKYGDDSDQQANMDVGEKIHITDVLLYVGEALPFIHAFCIHLEKTKSQTEQSQQSQDDQQSNQNQGGRLIQDDQQTQAASCDKDQIFIYKVFLTYYSVMSQSRMYFIPHSDRILCCQALFTMSKHVPEKDYDAELKELKKFLDESITNCKCLSLEKSMDDQCFHRVMKSEAMTTYEIEYESEKKLNDEFQRYISNYKLAYEGANKRHVQVRSKGIADWDGLYSEGITPLPLGHSFQEHVKIFCDRHIPMPDLPKTDKEKAALYWRNPKERLVYQLEKSLKRTREGTTILDEETQLQLDLKCLQILRAHIYNKIILIDKEDKDRNPKKYRDLCKKHLHTIQEEIQNMGTTSQIILIDKEDKDRNPKKYRGLCKKHLHTIQEEIQNMGTISRVIPLLSHPNQRIVDEVLFLLQYLLESVNSTVQNGLVQLKELHENPFIHTSQTMLRRAIIVYNEKQLLINQLCKQAEFTGKMVLQKNDDDMVSDNIIAYFARNYRYFTSKKLRKEKLSIGRHNRLHFLEIYQDLPSVNDKESLKSIEFHETEHASLIIDVISHMCDGQYRPMQDYLRDQVDSIRSVNIVEEIVIFIYELSKKSLITSDIICLLHKCFQALIELCSGNYDNSKLIFKKQIIPLINSYLQIDISDIDIGDIDISNINRKLHSYSKNRVDMLKLKAAIVSLLEVMLERVDSRTEKLTKQVKDVLNLHALQYTMLEFYALRDNESVKKEKEDDNSLRALFKTYSVILTLKGPEDGKPTEDQEGPLEAWNYCENNTRAVEVVYKEDKDQQEGIISKVYFNVNLQVDINDVLRDTVKYQVDRTTHSDRIRDFHKWMKGVQRDTEHNNWLKINNLSFVIFLRRYRYWFLLLLTLILNILVLVSYQVPSGDREIPTVPDISAAYQISLYTLGGIHTFLALWMVLEYVIVNWPHFVIPESFCEISIPKSPRFLDTLFKISWKKRIKKILPLFKERRTECSINIFSFTTAYIVVFLVASILSLAFYGYFYCICLLYMIIDNDILQRALQSITRNGRSLLWVAVLLLAVLFIYAVAAFAVFSEELNDSDNVRFCQSLDECFISVLRFGLIDNFLEVGLRNDTDSKEASRRFFYDVSFFIIITAVGLNIVFGIIIDTFAELREARTKAEEDMKTTCFICGLPSHKFDKRSGGFSDHVKNDHNMWDYIYYYIYLCQVDTSDHTAIEKYVYNQIEERVYDYIPNGVALTLKGVKDEEDEFKDEVRKLIVKSTDELKLLIHKRSEDK